MTRLACPNCGAMLDCGEVAIGRKIACPNCRVMLRLDADPDGRALFGQTRRRFGLVRLAAVLGVFLTGLGIGFVWGERSGAQGRAGLSVNALGLFSANNVVVSGGTVVSAPPADNPRQAPGCLP